MGHLVAITSLHRGLKLAGVLACVAFLGGCGAVEFEGKVFDYMGVSGDRTQPDAKMSERPPLLVPPNLGALPAPTENRSVAASRQDWPNNPENVRKAMVEESNAKKVEAESSADPLHAYAGKETLLDKLFKSDEADVEPVADVPEPDASDRVPGSTVAQSPSVPNTPHVPQAPLPDRNDEAFNPAAPDSYTDAPAGQSPAF